MNKWKLLIRRNWLASLIALSILTICAALFYFKHPASPYKERNHYVIRFEEIGTLSPGDRVQVNGLTRGQVLATELTEDAVFIKIEVFRHTLIPENSQFKLINSGLMGEREVFIALGDSKQFLADGDTAVGFWDEGAAGLSRKLKNILTEADSIMTIAQNTLDSVLSDKNMARLNRVQSKVGTLANETQSLVGTLKQDGETAIETIRQSAKQVQSIVSKIKSESPKVTDDVQKIYDAANSVLSDLELLEKRFVQIFNQENPKVWNSDSLQKAASNLFQTANRFKKHVKESNLQINVDIF